MTSLPADVWAVAPLDRSPLQQGDLLKDVYVPAVSHPPEVVGRLGTEPGDKLKMVVEASRELAVVVTQCCSIEHGDTVALAPVQKARPEGDVARQALLARLPVGPEGRKYTMSRFALRPLEPHLTELPDGLYWAVNLERTFSIRVASEELISHRVAAMTPEGRQLLRVKLGQFWARESAEDGMHLEQNGTRINFTALAAGEPETPA